MRLHHLLAHVFLRAAAAQSGKVLIVSGSAHSPQWWVERTRARKVPASNAEVGRSGRGKLAVRALHKAEGITQIYGDTGTE